jgi:hypothetical protein
MLIEVLLAFAISAILLPALLVSFVASRQGKVQQNQRLDATMLATEGTTAVRSVSEMGWPSISTNGTYHPALVNNAWSLASGSETVNGFSRYITIADVYRNASGAIATSGGTLDPSTKKVTVTVSWNSLFPTSVQSTYFVGRTDNTAYTQSTFNDFNAGIKNTVQITNTSGGEVALAPNTKGQWCKPSFNSATITLPDGPPVAVAAYADPNTTNNPNKVFVAVSPTSATSTKLAYLTVTATDPPTPTLRGTFTLDPAKYSKANLVPTGIGLTNSFITNQVSYYISPGGKTYALLATSDPAHEVIAILVDDGNPANDNTNSGEFQDYVSHIYKYWTFFNTRMYQGNSASTPNQDQAPYSAGASAITVNGNTGYATSGGFLYAFDLSNIDSKSTGSGLDMIGCRIELDGYDCNASTSKIRKYAAGKTGTNFQSEQSGQTNCMDGGNQEIYADNDIYPVTVSGHTYIYTAVGAGIDPELDIADVTSAPTGSTNPTISNSSCGTIASGNASWKRVSSLDFNSKSNTQETANSVFAKADGTRAYMSSNGTVDANNDGIPDSDQFYIIDTSNKSSPKFLSGTPSTGAQSGYYLGTGANVELYPRRSITVFGDSRALLAGVDGVSNSNNAEEYQVVNISNESTPAYCGGVQFNSGFNDMASIAEADGDKFVYLVGNTTVNELKIIQGGPDGTYLGPGVFESSIFDATTSATFNRFDVNATVPANTSLQYQVAIADAVTNSCAAGNYVFVGPDGTSNTYFASSSALPLNNDGVGYENPGRCMKYRAYLSTTDFNTTPILSDILFNFSP